MESRSVRGSLSLSLSSCVRMESVLKGSLSVTRRSSTLENDRVPESVTCNTVHVSEYEERRKGGYPRASRHYPPPRAMADVVPALDDVGIDLFANMIAYDPLRRTTAADAMKHHYFSNTAGIHK